MPSPSFPAFGICGSGALRPFCYLESWSGFSLNTSFLCSLEGLRRGSGPHSSLLTTVENFINFSFLILGLYKCKFKTCGLFLQAFQLIYLKGRKAWVVEMVELGRYGERWKRQREVDQSSIHGFIPRVLTVDGTWLEPGVRSQEPYQGPKNLSSLSYAAFPGILKETELEAEHQDLNKCSNMGCCGQPAAQPDLLQCQLLKLILWGLELWPSG